MPDALSYYPILNPSTWDSHGEAFSRKLLQSNFPLVPWVAYGEDRGDRINYLTRWAAEEQKVSYEQMDEKSLSNLAQRPEQPEWQMNEPALGKASHKVILRVGDDLTASSILDPAILQKAQDMLGCDMILVGIPHRFMMLACGEGEAILVAPVVHSIYEEARRESHAHLSPYLFCARDGELIGVAALKRQQETKGPGKHKHEKDEDEGEDEEKDEDEEGEKDEDEDEEKDEDEEGEEGFEDEDEEGEEGFEDEDEEGEKDEDEDEEVVVTWPRPTPFLIQDEGQGTLVLCLSCESFPELLRAAEYELEAYVPVLGELEGFDGPICVEVDARSLPEEARFPQLYETLSSEFTKAVREAGVTAPNANPVTITFRLSSLGPDAKSIP
ncbi:MAG: hypothetical protein HYU36_10550 [Planctomycetes bacterium]|nr:hypothetical protein [Planctomycetota bacterium]